MLQAPTLNAELLQCKICKSILSKSLQTALSTAIQLVSQIVEMHLMMMYLPKPALLVYCTLIVCKGIKICCTVDPYHPGPYPIPLLHSGPRNFMFL